MPRLSLKVISRFILVLLSCSFFSMNAHSQRVRLGVGYGGLRAARGLHHRNKAKVAKENTLRSSGVINVSGNEYDGKLIVYENRVVLHHKKDVTTYSYSDTTLHSVTADLVEGKLRLLRVTALDNKMWRLIKDTLGVKVVDKKLLHLPTAQYIDFHNLVFLQGDKHWYASGSMFSSTRKNIVKIINQLWNLHLNAKNFKSKEEIIDKLIHNDKAVYG